MASVAQDLVRKIHGKKRKFLESQPHRMIAMVISKGTKDHKEMIVLPVVIKSLNKYPDTY